MQQQLHHLESELARLQVELRQVRQMIGSLIRHEQETSRMMAQGAAFGNHAPQEFPQQMFADQQQEEAYARQMQQAAERMHQQLTRMTPTPVAHRNPQFQGYGGNPLPNDPMQRPY